MNTHKQIGLRVLAVLLSVLAGCQSPSEKRATTPETILSSARSEPGESPADSGEGQPTQQVFPAQFQATIYEVEALPGRVESVKAQSLEKEAGTAESLLKALSEIGAARILYRFDQPVNVLSQRLTMGKSEPLITGTRMTPGGQAINSVSYQQVGAIVSLSATAAGEKHPEVTVAVQLSVIAHGGVELAPGQKAASIQSVSTEHRSRLEFGQPRVMLAVDSASPDRTQPPALYVIRYQFGR